MITKLEWPLVLVNWVDSTEYHGWTHISEIDGHAIDCVSVGYLIAENNTFTTVMPHFGCNGSRNKQGTGILTIPNCAITNIEMLREAYNEPL